LVLIIYSSKKIIIFVKDNKLNLKKIVYGIE